MDQKKLNILREWTRSSNFGAARLLAELIADYERLQRIERAAIKASAALLEAQDLQAVPVD